MKKIIISLVLFVLISSCVYSGTAYHYQRTVFDNKFQRTILDPKAVNVTIGKNGKVFTFIDTSEGTDRIVTNVVNVGSLINKFGDNSINYVATDEDTNELRITLITTKTNSYSTIILQTIDKLTVYQLINK